MRRLRVWISHTFILSNKFYLMKYYKSKYKKLRSKIPSFIENKYAY